MNTPGIEFRAEDLGGLRRPLQAPVPEAPSAPDGF